METQFPRKTDHLPRRELMIEDCTVELLLTEASHNSML